MTQSYQAMTLRMGIVLILRQDNRNYQKNLQSRVVKIMVPIQVVRVISYHPVRLIHIVCTTAIDRHNIRLSSTCVFSVYSSGSIFNNGSIRLVS